VLLKSTSRTRAHTRARHCGASESRRRRKMSISAISSVTSLSSLNSIYGNSKAKAKDPSQMLSDVTSKYLDSNDSDGDGLLSSTEATGLPSDTFSKIDTNGDGKLSQDEMIAAAKTQMEAMRAKFEANASSKTQGSTQTTTTDSSDNELLKALMPNGPGGGRPPGPPPGPPPDATSSTDSTSSSSSTSSTSSTSSSKSAYQSILDAYQQNSDIWSSVFSENQASALSMFSGQSLLNVSA